MKTVSPLGYVLPLDSVGCGNPYPSKAFLSLLKRQYTLRKLITEDLYNLSPEIDMSKKSWTVRVLSGGEGTPLLIKQAIGIKPQARGKEGSQGLSSRTDTERKRQVYTWEGERTDE